jgi:hypothetical protein
LVARAVDEHVRESDDLDWKQALPADVEKKRKEFAKDVAAMANTRGGLIVYGVREEQERAAQLTPVPTGERERQRLRALATSHIRPLVPGLEIEPLNADSADEGLIIVSIPASPDAPHVVGERNEMGVPFRQGPHTDWMSEYQLERAYRDRFARQANEASSVQSMYREIEQQVDPECGVWLIVATRPLTPLPAVISRPSREQVSENLVEALRLAAQIYPSDAGRVPTIRELGSDAVNNPRVGLRRWVVRSNHYGEPAELTDLIHLELHHDGSTATAIGISRWCAPERFDDFQAVPTRIVESALTDGIAIGAAHGRNRTHSGRVLVTATLYGGTPGLPFGAVDNRVGGGYFSQTMSLVPYSRSPRTITPVQAEFATGADAEALRAAARQLSEDLLHQFGIQNLMIPE